MSQTPERPKAGHTAAAALLVTASTYVTFGFGLLINAITAHQIGPEDFGRYSFYVALVGALSSLGNHGLSVSGIRFVSENLGRNDKSMAQRIHGWLERRQQISILLVIAGFLLCLPWLMPHGWAQTSMLFAILVIPSLVGKAMYLFNISIGKGYRQFRIEAYTNVLVSLFTMVCVCSLYFIGGTLVSYLCLFIVSSLAYWIITAIMLRRSDIVPARGEIDGQTLARVRTHLAWTILLVVTGLVGNRSVETYLLNDAAGPAQVGFFSIALAFSRGGVELLSSGLSSVLMPSMAHAFGSAGNASVGVLLRRSTRYFHFMGLLLAGAGFCLSEPAIMLMYGTRFADAIPVLRALLVISGLTLCEGTFGAVLSITDNQRWRASFAAFSMLVNIVAAIALVPRYGLDGAVMTIAIARISVLIASAFAVKRIMSFKLPSRQVFLMTLCAAIAAIPATALIYFLPPIWGGLVAAPVFVLVLVGGTATLRLWESTDVRLLLSLIDRLPSSMRLIRPIIAQWEKKLGQPD